MNSRHSSVLTGLGVLVLPELVDDLHVAAARGERRHHALVALQDRRRHLDLRHLGQLGRLRKKGTVEFATSKRG